MISLKSSATTANEFRVDSELEAKETLRVCCLDAITDDKEKQLSEI